MRTLVAAARLRAPLRAEMGSLKDNEFEGSGLKLLFGLLNFLPRRDRGKVCLIDRREVSERLLPAYRRAGAGTGEKLGAPFQPAIDINSRLLSARP